MSSHERAISPVDELRLLRAATCDPRLCRGDVAVFAVILQHQNFEGVAFPGKNRLGKLAGLAPRNVQARVCKLEETGYVVVERRGQRLVNRYTVCRRIDTATGDAHVPRPDITTGDAGIPSDVETREATGDAGITQSGDARIHHLVMPASPELTTNSQSELTAVSIMARKPAKSRSGATFSEWIGGLEPDESAIPENHSVIAYCQRIGLPDAMLELAWEVFRDRYSANATKRYKDWPQVFRNAVEGNWLKLWYIENQQYLLTTAGQQAALAHQEAA